MYRSFIVHASPDEVRLFRAHDSINHLTVIVQDGDISDLAAFAFDAIDISVAV